MSAPPVPSFIAATAAVSRLALLRTLRGRKLRVALAATIVVILFPAVVALFGENDEAARESSSRAVEIVTGGIDWGFFRLLVFLYPVLFTSGAIGEEVEARTLPFLAMRPVSRASIALAKYLVGCAAALAVMWVGLILLHLIGYATSPSEMVEKIPDTARAGGAASLLVMGYSGICLFWGALVPEAAGMASVVWLGFFEWFVGLLPYVLRFISLNHWARQLGGLEPAGWAQWVPPVDTWIAAVVLVAGGLLFTLFGVLTVQMTELRFGKA